MVADLTAALPVVRAERGDGFWSVETLFTEDFIRDCFDGCRLTCGGAFRGNFYLSAATRPIPRISAAGRRLRTPSPLSICRRISGNSRIGERV